MASVHEYKRLENKLVQRMRSTVLIIAGFIAGIFIAIGKFLTRRYTIVFVPHSEKRVYNLHITVLSILIFTLVLTGAIGAFVWFGTMDSSMYSMSYRDNRLMNTQASLSELRDEIVKLQREARSFENALLSVLLALGVSTNSAISQNEGGDLSSILGIKETPEGLLQEISYVRGLSAFLKESVEPIREIGSLLDSQSALLTEIPSIWPVRNGLGIITLFFGQNISPIHGQYYIHKGIDISNHRSGDAVVATADGQVVAAEFTYDYGNYIIIRHKHGYYTRYAHLQQFRVRVGQRVQQNEVIGYIGNTGISTGAHLHYEVHVGSDVVDPYRYITLRSRMARQGR